MQGPGQQETGCRLEPKAHGAMSSRVMQALPIACFLGQLLALLRFAVLGCSG